MNLSICFKVHNCRGSGVLACCDSELIGKKLKKGGLEIDVTADFYRENETTADGLRQMMKAYSSINLLGKKAVSAALDEGIITQSGVINIGKVPHAVIMRI